jgi:acyl-CoA dehydrogenase
MKTRASKVDGGWSISGTKIWISKADKADFTILMALTSPADAARPEITAFLVDQDLPGISVSSPIRMLGGTWTYEVCYDDVRVADAALLGEIGKGFGPMQMRLATRRLEIACWSIGMAERALELMMNPVGGRTTFGQPLSERQSVQWWIAETAAGIHSTRLMAQDIAQRMDAEEDVSTLVSMIKFRASDMAHSVIENAMQAFGAMGMSKEMPLHLMAARVRLMRIYDGPNEIHRWVVARNLMRAGGVHFV